MTTSCIVLDIRGRTAAGHAWRNIVRCQGIEQALSRFRDKGVTAFKVIAADDGLEARSAQLRGVVPPFVDLTTGGIDEL